MAQRAKSMPVLVQVIKSRIPKPQGIGKPPTSCIQHGVRPKYRGMTNQKEYFAYSSICVFVFPRHAFFRRSICRTYR